MKIRKKPVVVDAWRLTGEDFDELSKMLSSQGIVFDPASKVAMIDTLEGRMTAKLGDWIICGINGEFYPCKHEILKKTYYIEETES